VDGQLLNDSLTLQASWDEDVEGTGGIFGFTKKLCHNIISDSPEYYSTH